MKKILAIVFILSSFQLYGQIKIVVGEFQNLSLYENEKLSQDIRKYIHDYLAEDKNFHIVHQQDTIPHSSYGLFSDSINTLQLSPGEPATDFVISGAISRSGEIFQLAASIVNVRSGAVSTEVVNSDSPAKADEMVEVLAFNIKSRLTGRQEFKDYIVFDHAPTNYYLIGTFISSTALIVSHLAYVRKRDDYKQATELADFDRLYDTANNLNKSRYVFASIAGISAVCALYSGLKNRSQYKKLACSSEIVPYFQIPHKGEYAFGIRISF